MGEVSQVTPGAGSCPRTTAMSPGTLGAPRMPSLREPSSLGNARWGQSLFTTVGIEGWQGLHRMSEGRVTAATIMTDGTALPGSLAIDIFTGKTRKVLKST